jgi:hypothetical protein
VGRGREGFRKIPGEDYDRMSKKANGTQMNADKRGFYFGKRLKDMMGHG